MGLSWDYKKERAMSGEKDERDNMLSNFGTIIGKLAAIDVWRKPNGLPETLVVDRAQEFLSRPITDPLKEIDGDE